MQNWDWINFITILYEKTLNQSMIDKKINEKEALELKKKHTISPLIKGKNVWTQLNSKLKMHLVI